MSADLQPVAVRADVVGVVDHPRREPEQLALELIEHAERGRVAATGGRSAESA